MSIRFFPFRTTMSIRTKLIVSAVITIGLALVVAITVVASSVSRERAAQGERFAVIVIKDVSDLNSLSYAYLLLKDKRPKVQWQLKHASLDKILAEHLVGSPEEEALLARLRSNHEQMKRLFDAVSEGAEKTRTGGKNASALYDELNEGVTAQLLARSEMMANEATLLGRESARHMATVRQASLILIFASTLILIVSAAVTAFFLVKSIGGSIRVLEQGTQRIAAGDLEYRVDVRGNDEISRLSTAFNDMATRLKSSYGRLEHEIAEQKRAEEALRLAGAYNRSLIEASLDPLVTIDPEGKISDVNAATELATGYARDELIGKDFSDYFTEPEKARSGYRQVFTKGFVRDYELDIRNRNGQVTPVVYNASVYRDEAGKVIGVFAAARDITERKRAEEETKRYAAQLELSNRELQDFAFVSSHDLQEPLRKIQAFGDQLKSGHTGSLDAEGLDYLDRMQNAAVRMRALIEALLNYSRITTRGQPFSPTDLTTIAREVVGDLETRIHEVGGQVEIGDLPTIEADPIQLRQLFQNLIGNALKFHGEEKPLVRIYGQPLQPISRSADGNCRIFVEDNGIGFDEKYLDRIFTPFQRLHGRAAYEGTGIGLAICRKIVDRHGGTITAKSAPRKGSTFIVTLPVKQQKGGTA